MVGHASLFSQMLSLVDRHRFERLVGEHRPNEGPGFSCWSQFVSMMFCELAQAKSLREIIDGLACVRANFAIWDYRARQNDPRCPTRTAIGPGNCLKRFSIQSWKWLRHQDR